MNKHLYVLLMVFVSIGTMFSQTQRGFVKTRGRMVNKKIQPGKGLDSATIYVAGRQAVLSKGTDGNFEFPVTGDKFLLQNVEKKGYQLIDYSVCTEYKYSMNPLRLVMEKPEQQQSDQLAAERKIRRRLQRQLQEREEEIEALKVSQQEKDSLLRIIYQQQRDNERLISDMAKRYSMLDYDQLDDFYRQVASFIENGELTRAETMLHSRGDVNTQVVNQLLRGQILQQTEEELQNAIAVHKSDNEELARRCYFYFESLAAKHQNDSAAHYLELRTQLDSTNVKWLNELGVFVYEYLGEKGRAYDIFNREYKQAVATYGEKSDMAIKAYINMLSTKETLRKSYYELEYGRKTLSHTEFIKEHSKELYRLKKEKRLSEDEYNNRMLQLVDDYEKFLQHKPSDFFVRRSYAKDSYYDLLVLEKKFDYLFKICEQVYGNNSCQLAIAYNNFGSSMLNKGLIDEANELYRKAIDICYLEENANDITIISVLNNIASVCYEKGDYLHANNHLIKALSKATTVLSDSNPLLATIYDNLGSIAYKNHSYDYALSYHQKALNIRKNVYGEIHPLIADSYNNLGLVYVKEKNMTKHWIYSRKPYQFILKQKTNTIISRPSPIII